MSMASRLIDRSYILQEKLGEGGMGAVYKAMQRLSGRSVALKLVELGALASKPRDSEAHEQRRLALAREFQTLASLHHPNIIQVLDYGFDDETGPYYTMELLPAPQNLLKVAAERTTADKLRLVMQVLWALAYLHRRGIIHRDLKPSNILCIGEHVKLLDFGLATVAHRAAALAGTLNYIAPELWLGAPPSVESDLYALGVILFEVLSSRPPFPARTEALLAMAMHNSTQTLLPQLAPFTATWLNGQTLQPTSSLRSIEEKIDVLAETFSSERDLVLDSRGSRSLASAGVDGLLGEVVRKLLAQKPSERFHSAVDVLDALSEALGERLPVETEKTRESFLQASRLIGRQAEYGELTGALNRALQGQGEGWLVGGESGVGKSRLLAEVRPLALVRKASVVYGQAVTEGGGSYQMWFPVLRALCLHVELEDEQAAVLKELLPGLPELLGHPLPDAPKLPAAAAHTRLLHAIETVFLRQPHPTVVLLEDLQWADVDSLELLEHLGALTRKLPLLIIGNFRDDEAPELPKRLAWMRPLRLKRLGREHVAELSASMLGNSGERPELVDYLYQETEGNVFFLIEVMRLLAEQAGQLGLIHQVTLPEHILTGGIERIAQRRVDRVPPEDRAWLDWAATLGRQLDLAVLRHALPQVDLERWLHSCADAAVLELNEGQWRFAHDKLREAILSSLPAERRRLLHGKVAHALETVYRERGLDSRSALLAYHFQEAGELDRASQYQLKAGDVATRLCSYGEARRHYAAALDVLERLPGSDERRRLQVDVLLRQVYTTLAADSAEQNFKRMAAAAALLAELAAGGGLSREDKLRQARVNYLSGRIHFYRGETREALGYYRQVLPVAQGAGDEELLALPSCLIGTALLVQGQMLQAEPLLAQAIGPLERLGEPFEWFRAVGYHGASLVALGRYIEGLAELERVKARARTIAQPSLLSAAHLMAGSSYLFSGDWPLVLENLERVLEYASQTGDKLHLSLAWSGIGWARSYLGQHQQARESRARGQAIAQAMGGRLMLGDWYDAGDAEIALNASQEDVALQRAREMVAQSQEAGLLFSWGVAERVWGEVLARQGDAVGADMHMEQCLSVLEKGGLLLQAARSRLSWALQHRARGQREQAERLYAQARARLESSGCAYALAEAERRWAGP